MKYQRIFILITELFCVLVLALCGMAAFSNSGLFTALDRLVSPALPSIVISLLIFLVLAGLGVFFVVLKNRSGGPLTVAVFILCLPSIFSFNNIDLFRIFGSSVEVTTGMTLVQMISVGSLVICAYFLLDLVHQLKLNILRFTRNQAPPDDIREVLKHQHLLAVILTGSALAFSLVITAIARGFEFFLTRNQWALSWWIIPMALFCITVLGVYLYWVTTRKNVG